MKRRAPHAIAIEVTANAEPGSTGDEPENRSQEREDDGARHADHSTRAGGVRNELPRSRQSELDKAADCLRTTFASFGSICIDPVEQIGGQPHPDVGIDARCGTTPLFLFDGN